MQELIFMYEYESRFTHSCNQKLVQPYNKQNSKAC